MVVYFIVSVFKSIKLKITPKTRSENVYESV